MDFKTLVVRYLGDDSKPDEGYPFLFRVSVFCDPRTPPVFPAVSHWTLQVLHLEGRDVNSL